MASWSKRKPVPGPAAKNVPVVSVQRPKLRLEEIHFATTRHGSDAFHYLYYNSNTHALLPGKDLQWWARDGKIIAPEWVRTRDSNRNLRACFTRNRPIAMSVKVSLKTTTDQSVTLKVTPSVDGSKALLKEKSISFTYPANAADYWVSIETDGALPDEVGRYVLRLAWEVTAGSVGFAGPRETRHRIYAAYGPPMHPDYDSASTGDTGRTLTRDQGTLSGTHKRLDHLTRLIGGANRRHVVSTQADLVDLYWKLHVGINDTPGAPPYFDAGHDKHITVDGTANGTDIPIEDQWLAWVRNNTNWNDASCIGHVQLAKTMLAALGLFARRTWVFPHTSRLPDGSTVSFSDTDLYCLGDTSTSGTKMQFATLIHPDGTPYPASPKLMEPGTAWENFEACMLSPNGKFLTGGYATSSNPASFRANKGFNSAAELLRWWCNTSRSGFGKRFMAWVYYDDSTKEAHCWDVDGTWYDIFDYKRIRDRGKELPVP